MFTSTPAAFLTPHTGQRDAGATPHAPAGWKPAVQVPTALLAGEPMTVQGVTPRPGASTVAGATSASCPAPWERLDASWPTLPESLTGGLDDAAQRLVRRCLTEAVGARLRLLRSLGPESRRLWETRPHLAQHVRQRHFFANLLPRYGLAEFQRLLSTEVALMVEVLETPPGRLGVEEWAALLELQCQRIGQLYAHLRERIGAQAQQEMLRAFQRVPGCCRALGE